MREETSFTNYDAMAALIGAGSLFWAWGNGALPSLIVAWLLFGLGARMLIRVYLAARKRLSLAFVRRPWARKQRAYLVQALIGCASMLVLVQVCRVSLIPEQFPGQYEDMMRIIKVCALGHCLLELIPTPKVRLATNALRLLVVVVFGFELLVGLRPPSRANSIVIDVPLDGDVVVMQGGPSSLVNHHHGVSSQRNALDLSVAEHGSLRRPGTSGLEAVPCFGSPIRAPVRGTVVAAVGDLPDMPLGQVDRDHLAGNHLIIESEKSRYVLLAHLRHASLAVKVGDSVESGEVIAACGNSGNTSEPHLHIQVQDRPTYSSEVTTIPILFRQQHGTHGEVLISPRRSDHLRRIR